MIILLIYFNYKSLFNVIIVFSVFLAFRVPRKIGVWVGLELGILRFICILVIGKKLEGALKYFIVQAWRSGFIVLSLFTRFGRSFLCSVGLITKLGVVPFFFWYPSVASCIRWFENYILGTILKIVPLYIAFCCLELQAMFVVGVLSCVVGSVIGVGVVCLRKIIAFSSIAQIGWLLVVMNLIKVLVLFFFIYTLIFSRVIYEASQRNVYFLSDKAITLGFFVGLLSLRGLPPLLGFAPKWVILDTLVQSSYRVSLLIVLCTLFSLFYYINRSLQFVVFSTRRWKRWGGRPLLERIIALRGIWVLRCVL